jgi:DNA replication protein DnaC
MGFDVLYRSIFDVVRDFLHEEALTQQDKVLKRYLKPDLLIIDDMGMKQLPRRSGEYLFEIVMRRYEARSTVMTSNRPLEDWGKLLGEQHVLGRWNGAVPDTVGTVCGEDHIPAEEPSFVILPRESSTLAEIEL